MTMPQRFGGRGWTVGVVVVGAAAFVAAGAWWWLGRDDPNAVERMTAGDATTAWFEDVTDRSGIDFTYMRGLETNYWLPEIMGGGAAWLDYDGDGDLDLYLVQGGQIDGDAATVPGNRLYRNHGDGTFEDVTDAAGVGDRQYGMGCACGDYDNDGDIDLYVTNVGPNVLYRNDGDGTFTDVTLEAGVGDPGWGTSSAFVDYDADGDLDLFVVNYIVWSVDREQKCFAHVQDYCSPTAYDAPAPDTLYRNEGDGTFVDVSESVGLRAAFGNGLGIACGDFNLDGHVDIFVANDKTVNQLWINTGDGQFRDEALIAGCAANMHGVAEAGMGVAAVDVESDGDLDLFMTHLRDESNTMYLNQGGVFEDITPTTGLSAPSIPFTGFGMGFADFDHDGRLDLYVANGRVGRYKPLWSQTDPYGEPNQLFRGVGAGLFEDVAPRGGVLHEPIGASRAAAFGDYDNDGDIDVVIVNSGAKVQLLRNVAGGRGNWIMFRLLDRRQRDAHGAMIRIEAGGAVRWRLAAPTYSYCACNDPRVHFGLGDSSGVDEVKVRWPSGRIESFGSMPAGRLHELREGYGRAAAMGG